MKIKKSDKIALIITALIILAIAIFAIINWQSVYSLLNMLISKTDLVREYIRDFGIVGKLILFLIIVCCFFFPIISSLPAQLALGIAYGLFEGTIIVTLAFFTASQIYYLIRKDLRIFNPEKIKKDNEIKNVIQNSKINIHTAMVIAYIAPFIPFIVISSLAYDGLKHYRQYLLYTLIGPVGEVIFTLYVGEKLLNSNPVASFISLICIIIFCGLSIVCKDKIINWIFVPKEKRGVKNGKCKTEERN